MPIDIPMRFENDPLLWEVEDVYSEAECQEFIDLIEASPPTLATNNTSFRDQDRVMHDEPKMAAELFRRLQLHLPERMGELTVFGLNERLRFYRYRPGQRFSAHMDHWYQPNDRQITLHTVLVDFNDDFEGETRFMEQVERVVRPRAGLAPSLSTRSAMRG